MRHARRHPGGLARDELDRPLLDPSGRPYTVEIEITIMPEEIASAWSPGLAVGRTSSSVLPLIGSLTMPATPDHRPSYKRPDAPAFASFFDVWRRAEVRRPVPPMYRSLKSIDPRVLAAAERRPVEAVEAELALIPDDVIDAEFTSH